MLSQYEFRGDSSRHFYKTEKPLSQEGIYLYYVRAGCVGKQSVFGLPGNLVNPAEETVTPILRWEAGPC